MEGPYEHSNEPSRSIKGRDYFDQLGDCQLLKKDSVSWAYLRLAATIWIEPNTF
jgi:hypothetical protein